MPHINQFRQPVAFFVPDGVHRLPEIPAPVSGRFRPDMLITGFFVLRGAQGKGAGTLRRDIVQVVSPHFFAVVQVLQAPAGVNAEGICGVFAFQVEDFILFVKENCHIQALSVFSLFYHISAPNARFFVNFAIFLTRPSALCYNGGKEGGSV